jgi:hypothetical protein
LATSNLSGYAVGGGSGGVSSSEDEKGKTYWSHTRLKRAYKDYLGAKREEIDEQQDARRFVHGSQWTSEQITQLNLRKQPVVFNNRTQRKINGIVGTLQRLKQDPKAYARTPKHEEGAELATAALRYALERALWDRKDPIACEFCSIDGIGGVEFNLVSGNKGDTEVDIDVVWTDGFFYDPRSVQDDFSDARYLGVGKWLELETAVEFLGEEYRDQLEAGMGSGEELSSDSDRDHEQWFQTEGDDTRLRLVECWYRHGGEWCWAIFTGESLIKEGRSPFINDEGKSEHKYEMFTCYTDQDGDRYGFVRNLKPLNQEINMRRSKALYTMLSRRIIAPVGSFDDVEVARREAARSDGIVIYNPQGDAAPQFDDTARLAETEAQFKFLEDVKSDFESFGPNIAVTGEGLENSSGRAIHLLQQSGLADLGPFMQSYRGWKIRVYRKVWNCIQRHWEGERWIRVTDDENLSQFIQVNGVGLDPMTNEPTLVNAIGELDVDIILDEGPDSITSDADAYDTLTALVGKAGSVPPEMVGPFMQMMIKLAPLPHSRKKELLDTWNKEPTPEEQQRKQIETQMGAETLREKGASADLKKAQAFKAMREGQVVQPEQPDIQMGGGPQDHPLTIQMDALEAQAAAQQKAADAEKKRAETQKIYQDIQLEPQRMAMEHQANQQKMQLDAQKSQADHQLKARQAEQSSRQQAKDSDRNYQVNKMKAKQKPAPRKS